MSNFPSNKKNVRKNTEVINSPGGIGSSTGIKINNTTLINLDNTNIFKIVICLQKFIGILRFFQKTTLILGSKDITWKFQEF